VVYQSYELWFKVIIDELQRTSVALHADEPWNAISHLRRMIVAEDLLLAYVQVLDSMSPEGFLEFRDPLNPASGFQSFQFRAIEFLSGGAKPAMLTFELFGEEQRVWLRAMSEVPSVWSGFEQSLRHLAGASLDDDVLNLARSLFRSHDDAPGSSLHLVVEPLIDHDERLAMWRHQHMLMAGRQIGRRPGTGGSEGMAYLDTTLAQRLYPVLWQVRSVL
jgi:tryptophan 2,3-dioxygenase